MSRLDRRELDYSIAIAHLSEMVEKLKDFPGYCFSHVGQDVNRIVHGFAQWAIGDSVSFRFDYDIPSCIQTFVTDITIYGN
ncbi:hypothetical protein V6N12_018578 [Hibiscus sabdariffa]